MAGTQDTQPGPALSLRDQVLRFVVTGGLAAVVDFGLYQLLLATGLQLSVAKSISFVAGTTTAYLINRRWTFRSSGGTRAFVAVVGLYATTFAVQVGLNAVLVRVLPEAWWRITLAFVIAQGTATVINFVVQRLLIFRTPDPALVP
ncbi:GtrA family protein [Rhodococcus aerolatus]